MRALQFTWQDCLFVHWPVERDALRTVVPDSLALDTDEGQAWVSALASTVENARPPGVPVKFGMTFPQVNFRTYVRLGHTTGVYFLSLDTSSRLAVRVARSLYRLPYYYADIVVDSGSRHRVRSRRMHRDAPPAEFEATYEPEGTAKTPESGTLSAFLSERYRLFVPQAGLTTRIEHDPWNLYPATADVSAESLFEAVGLSTPHREPRVRYCPRMEFQVQTPTRIEK
ncbi:hypothetical protein SAMN05421858_2058 [Haladaptatus litoreus]|uniref:DUF2071 domain-containing protein n=1 Tax=Haladaptatus litoreus TaxID=553468 RepID=A0A1N6ZJM3_9EURY|nr:DUF2071 domain-containing protein [Haladaptatus litoreus]SIR27025.1 hypothetical protein SAMN05421858_2058 [Haladaptatus litoreus]